MKSVEVYEGNYFFQENRFCHLRRSECLLNVCLACVWNRVCMLVNEEMVAVAVYDSIILFGRQLFDAITLRL